MLGEPLSFCPGLVRLCACLNYTSRWNDQKLLPRWFGRMLVIGYSLIPILLQYLIGQFSNMCQAAVSLSDRYEMI